MKNDPDPKGIFSSTEYDLVTKAFFAPSKGEIVVACKHLYREATPIFVGQLDTRGKPTGIGLWVKTSSAGQFWVRWVCLCRWCNLWRKLRRWPPIRMATVRAMWEGV